MITSAATLKTCISEPQCGRLDIGEMHFRYSNQADSDRRSHTPLQDTRLLGAHHQGSFSASSMQVCMSFQEVVISRL